MKSTALPSWHFNNALLDKPARLLIEEISDGRADTHGIAHAITTRFQARRPPHITHLINGKPAAVVPFDRAGQQSSVFIKMGINRHIALAPPYDSLRHVYQSPKYPTG